MGSKKSEKASHFLEDLAMCVSLSPAHTNKAHAHCRELSGLFDCSRFDSNTGEELQGPSPSQLQPPSNVSRFVVVSCFASLSLAACRGDHHFSTGTHSLCSRLKVSFFILFYYLLVESLQSMAMSRRGPCIGTTCNPLQRYY